MHTLTPRHRHKAGSGPPASALMAWIGTDPYLRDAATTACYRRVVALPLPSAARSVAAALTACLLLACGAALGICEIISHGRTPSQHNVATAPPIDPGQGVGQGGAATGSFRTIPSQSGSRPVTSPAPVSSAAMLVQPAAAPLASSSDPAPPPAVPVPAAAGPASARNSAASTVALTRSGNASDSPKPRDTVRPAGPSKAAGGNSQAGSAPVNTGNSDDPTRSVSPVSQADAGGWRNAVGSVIPVDAGGAGPADAGAPDGPGPIGASDGSGSSNGGTSQPSPADRRSEVSSRSNPAHQPPARSSTANPGLRSGHG